jgi:protein O-mannosyl-transferase
LGKKNRLKKERRREALERSPASINIPAWVFVLVAAVAILGFARSISFDFVDDDRYQILRNPWIRDWSNAARFFTTDVWAFASTQGGSNYYRPLQMLFYAAGNALSGLKPPGYHLINILLHAVCSIFVVRFGYRLSANKFASVAGGLLFALYPIHAESVAWIAGITDPLCAAFYFPALHFYLREGREPKNRSALILAAGCFLGALLSKEMAFTFPVVAAWMDWCLFKKLRWSRYAVFAAIFAAYTTLRLTALHGFFIHQNPLDLSLISRALSSVVLLGQYVAKMFIPHGMSAFHVFVPTSSFLSWQLWLNVMVLLAYAAAAWIFRRQRVLLFLFGFSMLTLAPLMNISGIGESVFADRYLYIPTLGSCLLVPLLVQELLRRWPSRPPWLDLRVATACLGLLLVVFGWMLWREIAVWRDPPTFYLETMKRAPEAALIANNLGSYYFQQGDFEQAQVWGEKALALWDKSFIRKKRLLVDIYLGLGANCFKKGKLAQGRDYFLKAYDESPNDPDVLQNLGAVWSSLRDYDQALQFYSAALKQNARNEVVHSDIAAVYLATGRFDDAIAHARTALEIYPGYGNACLTLARACAAKGMLEEARRAYLMLKSIDPSQSGVADAEMKTLGFSSQDTKIR